MLHKVKLIAGIVVLLLSSGCDANFHSVFRTTYADHSKVVYTDAKQSATIMSVDKDGVFTACAAKSPDVFQALSTAFTGSLGVSEANQAALNLSGAGSSAESAAAFGLRTQLTQTQIELLYQLCVATLNGFLTHDQLATEMHRYQNTMVTMLAIEQITGFAKPTIVALGGGTARTGATEALEKLEESAQAARSKEATLKAALEKATADAETKKIASQEADKKVQSLPADAKPEDKTKAETEAQNAKKALDSANQNKTQAEKDYNQQIDIRKGIEASLVKARNDTNTGSSGANAQIGSPSATTVFSDSQTAAAISDAVVALQQSHLSQTFVSDECVRFLFHKNDGSQSNASNQSNANCDPNNKANNLNNLECFCRQYLTDLSNYRRERLYLSFNCDKSGDNCKKDGPIKGQELGALPGYSLKFKGLY